jgi:hypothetical protein
VLEAAEVDKEINLDSNWGFITMFNSKKSWEELQKFNLIITIKFNIDEKKHKRKSILPTVAKIADIVVQNCLGIQCDAHMKIAYKYEQEYVIFSLFIENVSWLCIKYDEIRWWDVIRKEIIIGCACKMNLSVNDLKKIAGSKNFIEMDLKITKSILDSWIKQKKENCFIIHPTQYPTRIQIHKRARERSRKIEKSNRKFYEKQDTTSFKKLFDLWKERGSVTQ